MSAHKIKVIGLSLFVVIVLFSLVSLSGKIEADLSATATKRLNERGFDGLDVVFNGRDATLAGTVASAKRARAALMTVAGVDGVRVVSNALRIEEPVVSAPLVTMPPDPEVIVSVPMSEKTDPTPPPSAAAPVLGQASRPMVLLPLPEVVVPQLITPMPLLEVFAPKPMMPLPLLAVTASTSEQVSVEPDEAVFVAEPVVVAEPPPPPPVLEQVPERNIQLELDRLLEGKRVAFRYNQMALRSSSRALLGEVAEVLKSAEGEYVEIGGYTDASGSRASNLKLSQKRADVVLDYLVSLGVNAEQLMAKGYGEAHPVASNRTSEGRRLNRRVEFKILHESDFIPVRNAQTVQLELDRVLEGRRVAFRYNRMALRSSSRKLLKEVSAVLKEAADYRVEIAGHTDASGDRASNLALSQKRAEVVLAYLVSLGLDAEQLIAKGYGEVQPIANNRTTEGRRLNRRVEFNVLEDEQ